jgi:cysteinyl-tRNA synthetase
VILSRLDEILIDMKKIDRKQVESLVALRSKARAEKNWQEADRIRAELEEMGVELFDGHQRGWKVKVSE